MKRVITFGTFDVFHIGHLSILERAAALGDHLVAGVSTDSLNVAKKGGSPIYPQEERIAIVRALRPVGEAFFEESLEEKGNYIRPYSADVLAMGSDWTGRFDEFHKLCEVAYLPRTPSVSTTVVIERIRR
ncbi:MAG TPA: adenylyltransferase/cytidyltransferase family protein [Gammaproteobacteria bacterium]|nr:adenylyltransferase/cytidyltransferase family protein [Gammaproteobacteria bacterium]